MKKVGRRLIFQNKVPSTDAKIVAFVQHWVKKLFDEIVSFDCELRVRFVTTKNNSGNKIAYEPITYKRLVEIYQEIETKHCQIDQLIDDQVPLTNKIM